MRKPRQELFSSLIGFKSFADASFWNTIRRASLAVLLSFGPLFGFEVLSGERVARCDFVQTRSESGEKSVPRSNCVNDGEKYVKLCDEKLEKLKQKSH